MKCLIGVGAALLPLIAIPAHAAPATQPPQPTQQQQQQQPKSPAQIAYENEIVCQTQEVTGSRLGARRVCLTRGDWMRARMDDKAWVERIQHRGDASSQ